MTCVLHYIPVVMIADFKAAGLQFGYSFLRRPTMPETWGQETEVPDSILYGIRRLSDARPIGLAASENAKRMSTPGATMSGWKWKQKL